MADNYVLANGTLKNLTGAVTPEGLNRREAVFVPRRRRELFGEPPFPWTFDEKHLRAIHEHLFQDVFEWAGWTRDEKVRLSDGTVAHMPVMMRPGSKPFTHGDDIATELKSLFRDLKKAKFLTDLDRDTFANQAADLFVRLNNIHPFRDGNGRTQRAYFEALALSAGHKLDFSVVSNERNVDVAIRAHEGDPEPMRRLFREIANPQRVEALRAAQAAIETHGGQWRNVYMATTEPRHAYPDLFMVGKSGSNFMARTTSELLVGWRTDLPDPEPKRGERFSIARTRPRFTRKKTSGLDHAEPTLRSAVCEDNYDLIPTEPGPFAARVRPDGPTTTYAAAAQKDDPLGKGKRPLTTAAIPACCASPARVIRSVLIDVLKDGRGHGQRDQLDG